MKIETKNILVPIDFGVANGVGRSHGIVESEPNKESRILGASQELIFRKLKCPKFWETVSVKQDGVWSKLLTRESETARNDFSRVLE